MRLPRFQFSIIGMLAAMAVIGAALACIVKFGLSLPMATIVWGLLLFVLMLMPMLALVGKPERRTFYAGFAWFGWMYLLVLVFGFLTYSPNATNTTPPLRFPQMMIERAIFMIYKSVIPPGARVFTTEDPEAQYTNLAAQYGSGIWTPGAFPAAGGIGGSPAPFAGGGSFGGTAPAATGPPVATLPRPYRYVPWEIFRDLAHAAITILWAFIGGALAALLAARNRNRERTSASTTASATATQR